MLVVLRCIFEFCFNYFFLEEHSLYKNFFFKCVVKTFYNLLQNGNRISLNNKYCFEYKIRYNKNTNQLRNRSEHYDFFMKLVENF